MIESAGFDVCAEVDNGAEAIAKADQLHPDLILLDVYMPNLNGAEAAAILRKRNPDTPIVLFTIYEDSITASLSKRIGVDNVIGKASGLSNLVDSVRELLESSRPLLRPKNLDYSNANFLIDYANGHCPSL